SVSVITNPIQNRGHFPVIKQLQGRGYRNTLHELHSKREIGAEGRIGILGPEGAVVLKRERVEQVLPLFDLSKVGIVLIDGIYEGGRRPIIKDTVAPSDRSLAVLER